MKTRLIIAISLGVITFSSLTNILSPKIVNAYDNNNIMSDAVFDDTSTMSVSQIQSFLNGFPNSCLANYQAPYPNDYSNYGSNVSAATVIGRVSDLWHVNPRVILTTLEKEEGLVSGGSGCDSWRYNSAMGMGCPDGGACPAPGYAGFTAQVTKGTWQMQFSKYRSYGDLSWGDNGAIYYYGFMTAGVRSRVSGDTPVSYDGYATIDGTSVYMSNGATAALYTYTPHFSGNQHFVQIFNAWFGSTQVSDLVRTVNDASVYLVSGNNKYPISNMDTLLAYSAALGNISYVNQSYLDSKTTQPILGRAILALDGTVYFTDAGIRLPFNSCAQVSDYGYSCASLPTLSDYQINALYSGPGLTNVYSTISGKRFYVTAGTKREVYDDQSLAAIGVSASSNTLNESAISNLTYGSPVIRNDVFVTDRGNGSPYVYMNNALNSVDSKAWQGTYFGKISNNQIDSSSINQLTKNTTPIKGYIKDASGNNYIVTDTGKLKVTNPSDWSSSFALLDGQVLSQIPDVGTASPPYAVKSSTTNGTIYYLTNATLRPIVGWGGLVALNSNPMYMTIPSYYMSDIAQGATLLTPGSLVLSPTSATVYAVDGTNNLVPMGSFDPAAELGYGPITYTTDSVINSYTKDANILSAAVQCGTNQGLAVGGSVYPIALTGVTYTSLTTMNCSLLNWKSTAPQFLLANGGTIYQIQSGQKRPISSYDKYISLGGNATNTIRASDYILNYFTNGAVL